MSTGQGVIGCNMFAYCLNNPVNMTDESGCWAVRSYNVMMTDGGNKYTKGMVYYDRRDEVASYTYNMLYEGVDLAKYDIDKITIRHSGVINTTPVVILKDVLFVGLGIAVSMIPGTTATAIGTGLSVGETALNYVTLPAGEFESCTVTIYGEFDSNERSVEVITYVMAGTPYHPKLHMYSHHYSQEYKNGR